MIDNAEWLHAVEGGGEVGLCHDDHLVDAGMGFVQQRVQTGNVPLVFVVEVGLKGESGVLFGEGI